MMIVTVKQKLAFFGTLYGLSGLLIVGVRDCVRTTLRCEKKELGWP
jgi:hypothetical protein